MKSPEVNTKRILTTLVWAAVMVVPGGLPMLGLWVAFKAARGRAQHGQLASAGAGQAGG